MSGQHGDCKVIEWFSYHTYWTYLVPWYKIEE